MRPIAVLFSICVSLIAQLPQGLQDNLRSKETVVRERAVKELGAMDPTRSVSAEMLAAALVAALKDEDVTVRDRAAKLLGGNRPSDIAVPGLVQAFRAVDKDFDAMAKLMWGNDPSRTPKPVNLSGASPGLGMTTLPSYPGTILVSLRDHRDERAVTGIADVLAGWRLDRIPGGVIQTTCKELCLRGTAPALDAVIDLLVRAKPFVEKRSNRRPASDSGMFKPTEELKSMYRPLTGEHVKEIVACLDAAVTQASIEKPPSFDRESPMAWRDLLKANAAKIPKRLTDMRSASKPMPESNRAKGK